MSTIEGIVRQINRELVPSFEERLPAELIEQIVRLTLDAHSLD